MLVGVDDEAKMNGAMDMSVAVFHTRWMALESGGVGKGSCKALESVYSGSVEAAPVIWLVAWLQYAAT